MLPSPGGATIRADIFVKGWLWRWQCDSETCPDWERLRPVLDDAMSELAESDYDALVMRFFRNQDLRSVGRALGISDDTAQKRVSRALDKLRQHLLRRGITTTAIALSTIFSANTIKAAPAGLAISISTIAAFAGTSVHPATAIAASKMIAMTTLQKTLLVTTLAATVGTGIYEAHRASLWREQAETLQLQQDALARQNSPLQNERDDAATKLVASQKVAGQPRGDLTELLRLRAEVTRMRDKSRNGGIEDNHRK